jgi:phenylalanyl-tRNA synthetase beta chain
MLGTGVEEILEFGAPPEGVIFGVVQSCESIPDTHLFKLEVNVGLEQLKTIVTGASNARAGIGVAVAPPGVTIGGVKLEERAIQGVTSWGMVCSPKELGIGEYGAGILELPENEALLGTPLSSIWAADSVFDVEVTPNRADALSVLGIARDLAAKLNLELKPPSRGLESSHDDAFPMAVTLDPKKNCDRFVARMARGVKNGPSPAWLQRRLTLCGMRPINALVDASNYVMLELGQPSAAYDARDLPENAILVRDALEGERVVGLDGIEYECSPADLLVTTPVNGESRVIGIGSMLGAQYSSIQSDTTDVILEVAHWDAVRMRLTGRRLDIATDALYRYERGVDVNLPVWAADRYMQLVLEACGGEVVSGHRDVGGSRDWNEVALRPDYVNAYLGTNYDSAEMKAALERLGFEIKATNEESWSVRCPTWRVNMDIPEDLIEEIARVLGYDAIPETLPNFKVNDATRGASQAYDRTRGIKEVLVGLGFQEVLAYSFTNPAEASRTRVPAPSVKLRNPQSAERTHMRSSLVTGMLGIAQTNRSAGNIMLLEVGRVFPSVDLEEERLGLLMMGNYAPSSWLAEIKGGFYTFKGLLETAAAKLGDVVSVQPLENAPTFLHPGIAGTVVWNGQPVGVIGALHPSVATDLELPTDTLLLEVTLPLPTRAWAFTDPSRQPAALRDLAIIAPKTVPYAELERIARGAAGDYLEGVEVFDVFEGGKIPAGSRSVAMSLRWRAQERTLNDEEVNAAFENVISSVRAAGLEIRGG